MNKEKGGGGNVTQEHFIQRKHVTFGFPGTAGQCKMATD